MIGQKAQITSNKHNLQCPKLVRIISLYVFFHLSFMSSRSSAAQVNAVPPAVYFFREGVPLGVIKMIKNQENSSIPTPQSPLHLPLCEADYFLSFVQMCLPNSIFWIGWSHRNPFPSYHLMVCLCLIVTLLHVTLEADGKRSTSQNICLLFAEWLIARSSFLWLKEHINWNTIFGEQPMVSF